MLLVLLLLLLVLLLLVLVLLLVLLLLLPVLLLPVLLLLVLLLMLMLLLLLLLFQPPRAPRAAPRARRVHECIGLISSSPHPYSPAPQERAAYVKEFKQCTESNVDDIITLLPDELWGICAIEAIDASTS